jgi:c-di-GMP-binding flagellar brake protein YcgR
MTRADARRHARQAIRVPLYVHLPGTMFRKIVRVHSIDLSAGGLGFQTSQELSLDSHSLLVLEKIGDLPGAASVEGRVAHVQQLEDGRYQVGVEFSRFVNVTREEVERALRALACADPRREARYPVRVPLYVNLPDSVYRKEIRVESIDFSSGGLAFESSRELPIDSDSRVGLERIGNLPPESRIEGRVAHVRRTRGGERFVVGVEFSRLVGVSREDLRQALDEWRRAAGG